MSAAIPVELTPELLQRAATGQSAATLASWLAEAHAVKVTARTVQRHLARCRSLAEARGADRHDVAREVAQDIAAPAVSSELAELAEMRARARDYEKRAASDDDLPTAIRCLAEQRAALALAISVRGDGPPERDPLKVQESLMRKLQAWTAEDQANHPQELQ